MKEKAQKTLEILKEWVATQDSKYWSGFYAFGSLINNGGDNFEPHDYESDVDIIAEFTDDFDALKRRDLIVELKKTLKNLERKLLKILEINKTNNSILSITPITPFEIDIDVFKASRAEFFSKKKFYNLGKGKSINFYPKKSLETFYEYKELVNVLKELQEYRNVFLKNNNQTTTTDKFKEFFYLSGGIFPKKLMRNAAEVFNYPKQILDNNEDDLNDGNMYLISLVHNHHSTVDGFNDLFNEVRGSAGRGKQKLSFENIVLLSELLIDKIIMTLSSKLKNDYFINNYFDKESNIDDFTSKTFYKTFFKLLIMNKKIEYKENEKLKIYSNWKYYILHESDIIIDDFKQVFLDFEKLDQDDDSLENKFKNLMRNLNRKFADLDKKFPRTNETERLFIIKDDLQDKIKSILNNPLVGVSNIIIKNQKLFESQIYPIKSDLQQFLDALSIFDKEVNTPLRS